jgi:radical SAM protein with 4Fe4S-binding SPASM domain
MSNNRTDCIKPGNEPAFTLVEVLTALFLVMVGIGSGYALINQSLALSKSASLEVAAAYLGKEGIEIARSIRDDNYLKILYSEPGYEASESWMSGLDCSDCPAPVNCEGGCAADYNSTGFSPANVGDRLRYDNASGFFGYSGTKESLYSRTITVTPESDYLKVSVLVEWDERGRGRSLIVEENLYNWWPQ